MKYLLFSILSSFILYTYPFTFCINKHYIDIASNIFNVNNNLKYNSDAFNSVNFYNNNRSIVFNINHKNNITYMMKDKYNYIISFNIFKYKYLLFLKSKPISYNYTEIDVDIRRKSDNISYTNNKLRYNHYNKINNIIYKYIHNNIIVKKTDKFLATVLFKHFNTY